MKIRKPQISLQLRKAILTYTVKSDNTDSNYTLNLLQVLQCQFIWKASLKEPSSQTLTLVKHSSTLQCLLSHTHVQFHGIFLFPTAVDGSRAMWVLHVLYSLTCSLIWLPGNKKFQQHLGSKEEEFSFQKLRYEKYLRHCYPWTRLSTVLSFTGACCKAEPRDPPVTSLSPHHWGMIFIWK